MSTNVDALDYSVSAPVAGNAVDAVSSVASHRELQSVEEREAEESFQTVLYRDPSDVRTILLLVLAGLAITALMLLLAGLLTYKLVQKPSVLVVDRTQGGDRVVIMDDKTYGLTDSVQFRPDQPGDGDKKTAVRKWSEFRYQIDPDSQIRKRDLERLVRMMWPASAVQMVELVKKTKEWERQSKEKWQTVWTPQVVSISPDDPYKVMVVGIQNITKNINGTVEHDTKQLMFTLKLVTDKRKRHDDNQNTGYMVYDLLDFKELAAPAQATSLIGEGSATAASQPGAAAQN